MWQSLSFNRTRLAPTPSGFLHLGNLASFILTCHIARTTGAKILLRIDDLDQARFRRIYLEDIFETLEFMEIPWDEGPKNAEEHLRFHSQLKRGKNYEEAMNHLAATNAVFACDCSRSQVKNFGADEGYPGHCLKKALPLHANDMAWRLFSEKSLPIQMHQAGGNAIEGILPLAKRYLQVRKKDGAPSYQLSSVVDDIYYDVDLIVRGNDLLESSWAQLYLSGFLPSNQFSSVRFLHHPLLISPDGNKLSKSAGDTSIRKLREAGNTNRDVLNILGHRLQADREFGTWQELGDWMLSNWIPRHPS